VPSSRRTHAECNGAELQKATLVNVGKTLKKP